MVRGDLEARLNGALWAKPAPGDTLVVVTDASRKSREVAVRLLAAADELGVEDTVVVANKLRDDELDVVRSDFGAHSLVELAYNPALGDGLADSEGTEHLRPLVDQLFG